MFNTGILKTVSTLFPHNQPHNLKEDTNTKKNYAKIGSLCVLS